MLEFERKGAKSEVYTRRFPDITGGVCDFCGIRNNLLPSEVQYLQPHDPACPYAQRGGIGQIRCSYCPETVNPVDVVKQRRLVVHESPTVPGQLLAVCDSYDCSRKHESRFKLN